MKERPTLTTARLILRPFTLGDASVVQRLVGAREIAATTNTIPHPYEDGMAEQWITSHQPRFEAGELVNFAIVRRADQTLMGAIGLHLKQANAHAELGYWMGVPYWGKGYMTEAAAAVIDYAFTSMGLHRVYAQHYVSNPASGRVMQKIGMTYEGCLRQHILKWGQFEDLACYGILKSEYPAR